MEDVSFNRAFQTFDGSVRAHSMGAAIVTLWASLETLLRPGKQNIAKKLSAALATYIMPRGPIRNRTFQHVRALYEARGGAAHAAQPPEAEELLETFGIARHVFMRCIEQIALPSTMALAAECPAIELVPTKEIRKGAVTESIFPGY